MHSSYLRFVCHFGSLKEIVLKNDHTTAIQRTKDIIEGFGTDKSVPYASVEH